jgi:ATP-dependent RNA helicase RhlE
MPESVDAYTHRIGRTGRIDQKGDALTFVTAEDAALVKEIEKVLKTPLERRKLQGFDYNAPAPVSEAVGKRRSASGGQRRPQRAAGGHRR